MILNSLGFENKHLINRMTMDGNHMEHGKMCSRQLMLTAKYIISYRLTTKDVHL